MSSDDVFLFVSVLILSRRGYASLSNLVRGTWIEDPAKASTYELNLSLLFRFYSDLVG